MLTINEVKKFADMLDKEYAEEIKPLLKKAYEAIDPVLGLVQSDEYHAMRKRVGYNIVRFFDLGSVVRNNLYYLRYNEYTYKTENPIYHFALYDNLVQWLNYSTTCDMYKDGKLMSVFSNAEKYKGNIGAMVKEITIIKKQFETIKYWYDNFFIENNGEVFKMFVDRVSYHYNKVVNADKDKDNELYALFGKDRGTHNIRITITIEDI